MSISSDLHGLAAWYRERAHETRRSGEHLASSADRLAGRSRWSGRLRDDVGHHRRDLHQAAFLMDTIAKDLADMAGAAGWAERQVTRIGDEIRKLDAAIRSAVEPLAEDLEHLDRLNRRLDDAKRDIGRARAVLHG